MEGLVADYRATGLSLEAHPVTLLRAVDTKRPKISALVSLKHGEKTEVVGMVLNRQRPRSANGVTFLTIEDETGLLNLVVWPKVWEEYRPIARHSNVIGVSGSIQRDGHAIALLVSRFWAVNSPTSLRAPSRDFR